MKIHQEFLQEVKKKIDTIESQKISRHKVNIFSTLGVQYLENRHSAFLSMLLTLEDASGKKTFLESLLLHAFNELPSDLNPKIKTEQIHDNGRIDIAVDGKDYTIVIENKIYAHDQEKQLKRYYDAKIKQGYTDEQIKLVYLTLDGHQPTEKSPEPVCISYENEIHTWLSEFQTSNCEIDYLIQSYLEVIKHLTNKNSRELNMELSELLIKDDNLKTAIELIDAIKDAKAKVEVSFYAALSKEIKDTFSNLGFLPFDTNGMVKSVKLKNDFSGLLYINNKNQLIRIGTEDDWFLFMDIAITNGTMDTTKPWNIAIPDGYPKDKNNRITIIGEDMQHQISFIYDDFFNKSQVERDSICNDIAKQVKYALQKFIGETDTKLS